MKKIWKIAGVSLLFFFFAYGIASFLNDYMIQVEKIEGASMEPCVEDGDRVFLSPVPYWFGVPERFQVVAFEEKHELYVKRIIGLPGETISIKSGSIYIDGQVLPENYGKENMTSDMEPVILGDNEYFMLGDNRNFSTDSRSEEIGPVLRKQIKGKVLFK